MHRQCVVFFLLASAPVIGAVHGSGPRVLGSIVPAANPAQRIVSLDTVLRIARDKAPAIAAARARVSQAEEHRRAATLFPDLILTAGFGRGTPKDGGETGRESSFEVSQSLPAPWGLRARKEAGNAAITAATLEIDVVTRDVLREAKTLYYEAVLGAARATALAEAAKDARSLSELVGRRVEVGEAAGVDQLRTRVEELRAQSESRAAAAIAEGARDALNHFLLGALGPELALPDDVDASAMARLSDQTVEEAVGRTPALLAAQSRVDAARSALDAEGAARLPGLEISAFMQNEIDRKSTGVTFGLAIPLWNRNKAGVGIARAELAEAEAEVMALRARIEADVERLVRKDRAAQEAAASYRQEILPAARATLSIMRSSLEQGEANLLSWLEARRSYLETLRAGYEAELEALLTRADLERLIGDSHADE